MKEPIKISINRHLNSIKQINTAHLESMRGKATQKLEAIALHRPEKVNAIQRVLIFLNGKKTAIGILALAAGEFVPGAWGLVLKGIGLFIAPVGVAHKGLKVQTAYGKKGTFGLREILQIIVDLINQFISKK